MQIKKNKSHQDFIVEEQVQETMKYIESELNVLKNIPHEALIPDFINDLDIRICSFIDNACPSNKLMKQRYIYLDHLSEEIIYIAKNYIRESGFIQKGIGKNLAQISIGLESVKYSTQESLFGDLD